MTKNKFTNIKISAQLYQLLKNYPVFEGDGYKAISGCHHLLQKIHSISVFHDDGWVKLPRKTLENIFSGYNVPYNQAVTAMEDCKLLEPRKRGYYDRTGQGKSMVAKFKITELAMAILFDGELQYLRNLANDPFSWKAAADRRKKRRKRYNNSGDSVCDSLAETLFRSTIDETKLNVLISQFDNNNTKEKAQALNIAVYSDQIRTGAFDQLSRKSVDGRIYHPIVQIKSEARCIFEIGSKRYLGTLDLRACHPTFFGIYIVAIFVNGIKQDSKTFEAFQECADCNILFTSIDSYIFDNYSSNTFHFSRFQSSITSTTNNYLQYLSGFVPRLLEEYNNWNTLWTNPDSDPREQIATDVGYRRIFLAKKSINSAINGGKNRAADWIHKNYPNLATIWKCTDIKRTGTNISRMFETRIILNQTVIDEAARQNLILVPEHDGYGIFANPDDAEIEIKAKTVEAAIQKNCLKDFGLKPVLKFKRTNQV